MAKLLLGAFIFAFLMIFLVFNIYYSQNLSPIYFGLMQEDKKSTVDFLKKIKLLPGNTDFKSQLDEYKQIYGQSIENEVFAEDIQRKQTIKDLKLLLEKNPKSRDVLYNLYLLEQEDGNKTEAKMYLEKAKEIDPALNK